MDPTTPTIPTDDPDAVAAWQRFLRTQPYGACAIDGVYDHRTQTGTLAVQVAFGMVPNGRLDNETAALLRYAPTSTDTAAIVTGWQERLRGTPVLVDGTYTAGTWCDATAAATKAFQARMGVHPDGVADRITVSMAIPLGFELPGG